MKPITLALVGIGKIARDQHVPAITGNPAFRLLAAASPNHRLEGVPNYPSLEAMLEAHPDLDAVSICTPPQIRYALARHALERGCAVMLEKPPGATQSEVVALAELAERKRTTLFATWHSREAAGVEPAREWLANRAIRSVTITWKEDVRVWHPGQRWIWMAGGLGVFDPGINALSILTRILPDAVFLKDAWLEFPENCATPIAATLHLETERGAPVRAAFDFRQTGPQTWDIEVQTGDGRLLLSRGGSVLHIDGKPVVEADDREYANLYARFARLVRERTNDVDVSPLRLVADAFLCGTRVTVAPFQE